MLSNPFCENRLITFLECTVSSLRIPISHFLFKGSLVDPLVRVLRAGGRPGCYHTFGHHVLLDDLSQDGDSLHQRYSRKGDDNRGGEGDGDVVVGAEHGWHCGVVEVS